MIEALYHSYRYDLKKYALRFDLDTGTWKATNAPYYLRQCATCNKQMMASYASKKCPRCGAKTLSLLPVLSRQRAGLFAHAQVHKAIRKGHLPKIDAATSCVECGAPAKLYDHRDYDKPLDVQPVCHPCNKRRGPALWTPRPDLWPVEKRA